MMDSDQLKVAEAVKGFLPHNEATALYDAAVTLEVDGPLLEVERPSKVKASFINLDGQKEYIELEDLMAVVVQHEIDHLDGKLMVDFISSVKREMIRKKLSKKRS